MKRANELIDEHLVNIFARDMVQAYRENREDMPKLEKKTKDIIDRAESAGISSVQILEEMHGMEGRTLHELRH